MAESAKLVSVCRSDDHPFERRQFPLAVDDTLTMVLQFSDTCVGCNKGNIDQKDMESFVEKFHMLSKDEVAVALMVTNKELLSMLSQLVACVGCRRSVERLFNELVKYGYRAIEPLIATPQSVLSIDVDYLFDPRALYALLYVHGSRFSSVMESIPRNKKSKRCNLHSLDTHKTRPLGCWIESWDVLSKECREELLLVECDTLMDTVENYLRKHRFCSECKSKVQRAYSILVGEADKSEKGYCAALYDGLRCCTGERHIHVSCETDFVDQLISRAEPELSGSRRERHAKTLDIAQEEVLTCLGIHLYERLYKVWQKVRAEEQTWQILFYLGVDALRKSFEVALEKKRGISNLELMCEEILQEERAKEKRKELKKQKRKNKKNKAAPKPTPITCQNKAETECDDCSKDVSPQPSPPCTCSPKPTASPPSRPRCGVTVTTSSARSDAGYSSGHEGCESCSNPGSREGSDIACSEDACLHDSGSLNGDSDVSCRGCDGEQQTSTPSPQHNSLKCECKSEEGRGLSTPLSLEDMLKAGCCHWDGAADDVGISEEEIRHFKASQPLLNHQRQELRRTLRQRFDLMQLQKQSSTSPPHTLH